MKRKVARVTLTFLEEVGHVLQHQVYETRRVHSEIDRFYFY